ncbi:hypothetical protein BpHYR1_043723 [Brachionus plicatilis]|uniref:Uncharacterized protein n=1 Tax=Brachionus plicatilis TaxID=10195 RepID=A0A3M7PPF1_BRAPC|nr:hypothetical protein BpHYR1_043723 [Brachionus plicatilis]
MIKSFFLALTHFDFPYNVIMNDSPTIPRNLYLLWEEFLHLLDRDGSLSFTLFCVLRYLIGIAISTAVGLLSVISMRALRVTGLF